MDPNLEALLKRRATAVDEAEERAERAFDDLAAAVRLANDAGVPFRTIGQAIGRSRSQAHKLYHRPPTPTEADAPEEDAA